MQGMRTLHIHSFTFIVRNKNCQLDFVGYQVMEVLTHVNKRLKSRPMVQLPVEALLQQYQTTDSTFLHNFSIIYVTMGFPRMSQEQQVKSAPLLLNCLEEKPENHQDKYVQHR